MIKIGNLVSCSLALYVQLSEDGLLFYYRQVLVKTYWKTQVQSVDHLGEFVLFQDSLLVSTTVHPRRPKRSSPRLMGWATLPAPNRNRGAQVSNLSLAATVRPVLLSLRPSDHTHVYTPVKNPSLVPTVRQSLLVHHPSRDICVPTLVKSPSLVRIVRQSSLVLQPSRDICVLTLVKSPSLVPTVRQSSLSLQTSRSICVPTQVKNPSLVPTVRQSSLALQTSRDICVPTLVKVRNRVR